jgi:hypothetical protein
MVADGIDHRRDHDPTASAAPCSTTANASSQNPESRRTRRDGPGTFRVAAVGVLCVRRNAIKCSGTVAAATTPARIWSACRHPKAWMSWPVSGMKIELASPATSVASTFVVGRAVVELPMVVRARRSEDLGLPL